MKRPAFQFYPGDWRGNAKLRRCTHAERGIWIDVLCLLHDSEEYGVLRWPLKDMAQASGCKLAALKALLDKGVLKGSDVGVECVPYIYTPRHAGKIGIPVTLVPSQVGPIWFSSRMVRDEHLRLTRGAGTRFGETPQYTPSHREGETPNIQPSQRQGDGASSSSSTSKRSKTNTPPAKARAVLLPENFGVSDRVREWAADKGHDRLDKRLEHFVGYARANAKKYADWDQAFMNAIRDDWAKLKSTQTPDYSETIANLED